MISQKDSFDVKDFFDYIANKNIKYKKQNNEPSIISQFCNSFNPTKCEFELQTLNEAKAKFSSLLDNQILKRYIKSSGKRMQIIRLIYYSKSKSPYAILITNKSSFENGFSSLNYRYYINDALPENYNIEFQYGKTIEDYLSKVNSIIYFLLNVLIKRILDIGYSILYVIL